jgi:hypothetical protein
MHGLGEAYEQIEPNRKREKSIHTVEKKKKGKGATTGHSTAARSPKGWTRAPARSRRRRHQSPPNAIRAVVTTSWISRDVGEGGSGASREKREEGGRVASGTGGAASHPRRAGAPDAGKNPAAAVRHLRAEGGEESGNLGFPGAGCTYIPSDLDGVNLRRRSGDRRSAAAGAYLGQKWPMRGVALRRLGSPAVGCRAKSPCGREGRPWAKFLVLGRVFFWQCTVAFRN